MREDMQEIFLEEIAIHDIVTRLGDEITRDFQGEEVYAICILKGASLFFADLVRSIKLPVQIDFMQLSSYGNKSASSGEVKILLDLTCSVEGKNVIIVEDIVDTGLSMNYLMENLRHRKAKTVRLCSLLSKPARRKIDVEVDYCGIEVPDAFLVGYGLDYAQKYRNLPYIGVLKPEIYVGK